jgi:hypothetical protein
MAISSRDDLIDYCRRKLGEPVIQLNIDDDQISDRVDEALAFFQQYHFDATQKVYISHLVQQSDIDNRYIDLSQASGLAAVTAGSVNVVGTGSLFASEFVVGNQIKINGETRTVATISGNLGLTVTLPFTNSATSAVITNVNEANAITGVNRIFPVTSAARISMFDIRYQMRLHDLFDFSSVSYTNYTLTMQHLRTIDMLFTGEAPVRFNKHQNRLYVDVAWGESIQPGEFMLIEAYKIVNPDSFTDVWNDKWLKMYTTALIKQQWGTNLKKYSGIALPGNITFNGQVIYDEATAELAKIEEDMQSHFETPPMFLIG